MQVSINAKPEVEDTSVHFHTLSKTIEVPDETEVAEGEERPKKRVETHELAAVVHVGTDGAPPNHSIAVRLPLDVLTAAEQKSLRAMLKKLRDEALKRAGF